MPSQNIATLCLVAMRVWGRGNVRRSLESLVNRGIVSVDDAARVWRDAFGGRLIAVPDTSARKSS